MSSRGSRAKRQRTDSSSDTLDSVMEVLPVPQRPRHSKLWFKDGSVVFATETMLFCVYRGILSSKSHVFRDMFSLPQPEHSEDNDHEFLEGKPVIVVSEDEDELGTFFLEIFLQSYFRTSNSVKPSFDIVSTILRLSIKYEMSDMRKEVIHFLKPYFPTTLEQWQTFQDQDFIEACQFGEGSDCKFLQLFEDTDLDFFVPAAYLWVSLNTFNSLARPEGCTSVLSPSSKLELFMGRTKMLETIQRKMLVHVSQLAVILRGRPCKCRMSVLNLPSLDRWRKYLIGDHAFSYLNPVIPWMDKFCSECKPDVTESYTAVRRELWKELPVCFRRSPWETLIEQLESALTDEAEDGSD